MNFKTFLEIVRRQVDDALPGDLHSDLRAVQKNNGTVLTGLTLTGPGVSSGTGLQVSPIVYLEEFYQRYLRQPSVCRSGESCGMAEYCKVKDDEERGLVRDEDRSVYPCLNAFSKAIAEILLARRREVPDIPDLENYEEVRHRLFVRLVGGEANEERLAESDSARRQFLDMTVIYYLMIEGPDREAGGIRVTWNMLGDWGISEEYLFRDALANTRKMMGERLLRFDQNEGSFEEDRRESRMMVLSNEKNFCGASVILYSEELPRVAEELDSDLYILPSSIHEVILTPSGEQDPEDLRQTVRRVNDTEVRREEILTYSVYLYDRRAREIRIV